MIQLSPRQLDCLAGAARGDSDAEIAERHHLSVTTVRTYMADLRELLGARNRAHAVHLGWQAGLLGPDTKEGA